jgi:hypothetical protein
LYCRVKWLSTDVSEVCTASIISDDGEHSSEHHTRRRENLKSHKVERVCRTADLVYLYWSSVITLRSWVWKFGICSLYVSDCLEWTKSFT